MKTKIASGTVRDMGETEALVRAFTAIPGVAVSGAIWLNVGKHRLVDGTRTELLEEIRATGSISQAARNLGVSYKWLWDTIGAMEIAAGTPLVEKVRGGRTGGGSRLTPVGTALIDLYRRLETEQRRQLTQLAALPETPPSRKRARG